MPILVSYCYLILILGMQEWFQRICHNKTIAQAKSLCNIYIYILVGWKYIASFSLYMQQYQSLFLKRQFKSFS